MRTLGNKVACKPPKSTQNQVTVAKGFAKAKAKLELLCLEVVYTTSIDDRGHGKISLQAGDFIYIKNEGSLQEWARTVFKTPGNEDEGFILVPGDMVLAVDHRTYCKEQSSSDKQAQPYSFKGITVSHDANPYGAPGPMK